MFKLYTNGMSAGVPPAKNDHKRAKRGDCTGWSKSATRNNRNFLYSVLYNELGSDYLGHSFTLTVKNCPETSQIWHKLRDRFFARLRRIGIERYHWVTEWQRRGVPHMHGCIWLKDWHYQSMFIVDSWIACAKEFGAEIWCQDVKRIETPLIWAEYLSKHAARGERNYQRCNSPEGWDKVGKVWGKGGNWPVRDPIEIGGDLRSFQMFRRIVKRWRIAQSRGTKREIYARKLFVTSKDNRNLSNIMGISEWLPLEVTLPIVHYLSSQGYDFS